MVKVRNFLHFILFGVVFLLISVFIRSRKGKEKIIGFASSHFSGNIKYLYLEMVEDPKVKVFYVTGEKDEIERVRRLGVDARYYREIKSTPLFLRTHAWITSHGIHYIPFFGLIRRVLPYWKWKHGSKWIDVWHGLGWVHTEKNKMLRDYDLSIDTSEFFREYYSEGDGNIAAKIKIAGYPRNDPLIDKRWSREEIEKELGIPTNRKNILYAPTWGHRYEKKLFTWEKTRKFLREVEKFCEKNGCNFFIRMHPNWYKRNAEQRKLLEVGMKRAKWIFHISPYKLIDTQPLLCISDVLITDWSSISNDFILLKRPIIFIEIQFPVEKCILKPEERAGYIVKNKKEFFKALYRSIMEPNLYEEKRKKILKKLYKYVDGNSAKRCSEVISKLLQSK